MTAGVVPLPVDPKAMTCPHWDRNPARPYFARGENGQPAPIFYRRPPDWRAGAGGPTEGGPRLLRAAQNLGNRGYRAAQVSPPLLRYCKPLATKPTLKPPLVLSYHPPPVRLVEIPKDNGSTRSLGIRCCPHNAPCSIWVGGSYGNARRIGNPIPQSVICGVGDRDDVWQAGLPLLCCYEAVTLHVREPGGLRVGRRLIWADGPRREGDDRRDRKVVVRSPYGGEGSRWRQICPASGTTT